MRASPNVVGLKLIVYRYCRLSKNLYVDRLSVYDPASATSTTVLVNIDEIHCEISATYKHFRFSVFTDDRYMCENRKFLFLNDKTFGRKFDYFLKMNRDDVNYLLKFCIIF